MGEDATPLRGSYCVAEVRGGEGGLVAGPGGRKVVAENFGEIAAGLGSGSVESVVSSGAAVLSWRGVMVDAWRGAGSVE